MTFAEIAIPARVQRDVAARDALERKFLTDRVDEMRRRLEEKRHPLLAKPASNPGGAEKTR